MTRRVVYVVVGICAFAVAVADATVGVVPLALGRPVVNLVAVVALVFAYQVGKRRRRDPPVESETPDPEHAAGSFTPGTDLRSALVSVPGVEATGYHGKAHTDLRDVAAGALRRYTPRDGDEAAAAVSDGTWTDDASVLAFLGDGAVLSTPGRRLRRYLTGESGYQRGMRDAVAAIAGVAGTEAVSPDRRWLPSLLDRGRPHDSDRDRTVRPPEEWRPTDDDPVGDGSTGASGARDPGSAGDTGPAPRSDGGDEETTDLPTPGVGRSRATGRWRSAGALGLVCVAVGVVFDEAAVVLGAAVVVVAVAYGRTGTAPPLALRVERTVDEGRHEPGEPVEVTVRVHNESDARLPDLRLVDGVPEALAVESGSPRYGTALGPGGTATWSYAVAARRGRHEFGPTMAICRDLAGTAERVDYFQVRRSAEEDAESGESADAESAEGADAELTDEGVVADGDDTDASAGQATRALVCRPRYRATTAPVPLRRQPARGSGPVTSDVAGSGVEFTSTREYRPGDPPNRVDWNRLARTGTLGTTEFREERVATVVLVVDARHSGYCSPVDDEHALDRSVDAAGRVAARLLSDGHRVGLVTFGPSECWLSPKADANHADRFDEALALHEALSPLPDAEAPSGAREPGSLVSRVRPGRETPSAATQRRWRERIARRLAPGTQLLVCSPLVDDGSARLAREFEARDYPVTVLSPDPTANATPGQALAGIGRRFRVTDLRRAGIPVVDWHWTDSLEATLERYAERER